MSLSKKEEKKEVLHKREEKYLIPDACRVPILYTIPKIHKDPLRPPGRPIIIGIQSINSILGEYVDKFIQPLVPQTQAFLRDTKHLIQILDTVQIDTSSSYLLATADVASLYMVINHDEAIQASKRALNKFGMLILKQNRFVLRCLAFGLQHNYYWHDYYRQLTGIGMGAKYAPSVANVFMSEWEETVIYANTPVQLVLYRRYIDDCIVMKVHLFSFLLD